MSIVVSCRAASASLVSVAASNRAGRSGVVGGGQMRRPRLARGAFGHFSGRRQEISFPQRVSPGDVPAVTPPRPGRWQ